MIQNRMAIIGRRRHRLIEMSLQVFLMICKKQYSAKPTTGGQSMIVWAESVQEQVCLNPLLLPRPLPSALQVASVRRMLLCNTKD